MRSLVLRLLLVGAVVGLGVAGCGDDDDSGPAPTVESTTSSSTTAGTSTSGSVPTSSAPSADPRNPALPVVRDAPRPDGRDPAVALGRRVALEQPSALADPPGAGPILVSTLDGRVHQVDLGTGSAPVVLDISGDISSGGERGLLGIAVDPRGDRLYADFTDPAGDTRVRSWALDAAGRPVGAAVEHLHIDQPFPNHNGGNLVFGPDGALWIGTGDGGSAGDPQDRAQDPADLLGKMLRVVPDPAGGLHSPSTNPRWGARPEVWGIGLRNPWRYSFDRATNRLWVADVGQGAIEEVTVIDPRTAAPNFGWDDVEGDRGFEGSPQAAFTAPAVVYGHDAGCSVTGGHVYRGEANPGLYGWYLFADYCGGWVRAVPSSDPGSTGVELLSGLAEVISFGELENGELVLLTVDGLRTLVAP